MLRHSRRSLFPFALVAGLLAVLIAATAPADVVILKDGFTIQGTVRKEMESVSDTASKTNVLIAKGNGFDLLSDGVRVVVFSTHHKQLGEISKDVKIRPDYKAYTNPLAARQALPMPPLLGINGDAPDFNAKWRRTLNIQTPEGFLLVEQQITYLDPYCCMIVSPKYRWGQGFRTTEMEPAKVRKLLSTHPELVEQPGKPEPLKRLAIARFMKDVGWLYMVKEELARLKKDVPDPLPKDAQEQLDKLNKEMDAATAELVANEAEQALGAGRYKYAEELLAAFPEKTADPKDLDRATRLMARLKTAKEQYDTGKRLLRSLIDEATGARGKVPFLAVGGGAFAAVLPKKAASTQLLDLTAAAEVVYAELHPDSAGRIEFFVNLASQAERERAQGQEPTKKPDQLLATAISGWAKGKIGATPEPDLALQIWAARKMVLDYQRGRNINQRSAVALQYHQGKPIGLDDLAQIITLLPPAEPEDLTFRTGTLVKAGSLVPEGVYRRRSVPYGDHPAGMEYFIRLPPEYHHGRAYPVIVLLTYPGVDAEQLMGTIANEADKHGYIIIAPNWAPAFGDVKGWSWDGTDHDFVTGTLRDAIRHFTIDNDRVFMIGAGAGADMAMDVGVSHPDLFAGVVTVGANPKWQGMLIEYWSNAQKLPFYMVSGELAGVANEHTRQVFQRWMPNGFPALQVIYRGRGLEWYPAETPVMFDWMSRKKRVNGTAVLALGNTGRFDWRTQREGDNHFYWLSADEIDPKNLTANRRTAFPAAFQGDIKSGNRVTLKARGVRTVGVWLSRDMIDWSQKVHVSLNGYAPNGWKPKVLEPDIHVLLEDYWHRGDRRMLYLAKLEFHNTQ